MILVQQNQIILLLLVLLSNKAGFSVADENKVGVAVEKNDCKSKVDNGECNSDPSYMIKHCRDECFADDEFVTFGFFDSKYSNGSNNDNGNDKVDKTLDSDKKELRSDALLGCYDIHDASESDGDESCEDFVENGECVTNPYFMIFGCAQSCLVCFDPEETIFPIGVAQEIHPDIIDSKEGIEKTMEVIIETYEYMQKVMTQHEFKSIRTLCYNMDEYCSTNAATGGCEMPENYDSLPDDDEDVLFYESMMVNCAPACQSCDNMLIDQEDAKLIQDCLPDFSTNVFSPGDVNRMFERMVGESSEGDIVVPKSDVKVLSRPTHPKGFTGKDDDPTDYVLGPWVVTLDNFLSHSECDRLIELGDKIGYSRSTMEDEEEQELEEEATEKGEEGYRTSTTSWCQDDCAEDPVTISVTQRMTHATGIPDDFAEYLQLLSYVPGQYYKEHHDYIPTSKYHSMGPRMLTFYLYLEDVEDGGETGFTDLTGDDGGITTSVKPKKGMALIWPSVLDEDPSSIDDRTYHEAMPLLKGRKFGANAWFRLRSFKSDACQYEELEDLAVKDEIEDTEEEDEDVDENVDEDDEEDDDEDGSPTSDEL